MVRLIFYLVWGINIIFLYRNKDSKILATLSFVTTFIVFGGNNNTADYQSYKMMYETGDLQTLEPGYVLFCNICKALGFEYQLLVFILVTIVLVLIAIMMKEIEGEYSLLFSALFFFETFMGIVQIRHYVATMFLAMALIQIKKKKRISAIMWNALAVSFHVATLLFLPFFLFYKNRLFDIKKVLRLLVYCCFICFFTVFIINLVSGVNILTLVAKTALLYIGSKQKALYATTTRFGGLLYTMLYVIDLWSVYYVQKKTKTNRGIPLNEYDILVRSVNLYVAVCVPFMVVSTIFYRFFRMVNIMNYIYFAHCFNSKEFAVKKTTLQYYKCISLIMASCMMWKIFHLVSNPEIYQCVYKNNVFLKRVF